MIRNSLDDQTEQSHFQKTLLLFQNGKYHHQSQPIKIKKDIQY